MPAYGRAGARMRKEGRSAGLVGLDPTQGALGAHAPFRGFLLSRPARTFERLATAPGGLPKWDGPTRRAGEFGENSLHLYRGVFSAKSVRLFHNFLNFLVGASVGVVRGRLLTNASKFFT